MVAVEMRALVLVTVMFAAATGRTLVEPKPANGRQLEVGRCQPDDKLLHSETIVINNDGHSRVAGDVRLNVEAAVRISCAKVVDRADNSSGGHATLLAGGVGHNYITVGFSTAYGHSLNLYVELYGPN